MELEGRRTFSAPMNWKRPMRTARAANISAAVNILSIQALHGLISNSLLEMLDELRRDQADRVSHPLKRGNAGKGARNISFLAIFMK
jgi:hypothetical protein